MAPVALRLGITKLEDLFETSSEEVASRLADALILLADSFEHEGRLELARAALSRSVEIRERLIQQSSQSMHHRYLLAKTWERLGDYWIYDDQAKAAYLESVKSWARARPLNSNHLLQLSVVLNKAGDVRRRRSEGDDDIVSALKAYWASLSIRDGIIREELSRGTKSSKAFNVGNIGFDPVIRLRWIINSLPAHIAKLPGDRMQRLVLDAKERLANFKGSELEPVVDDFDYRWPPKARSR